MSFEIDFEEDGNLGLGGELFAGAALVHLVKDECTPAA